MLTYALLLMLWIDPYIFGIKHWKEGIKFVLVIFFSSALIPAFGLFMLKALKLVKSIELDDKMDRIGPFIIAGIFYLWLLKNLYTNNNFPDLYTAFVLGATISLFTCFVINVLYKISIHAAGIAGLFSMICLLIYTYSPIVQAIPIGSVYVSIYSIGLIGLFTTGVVGTSRLSLKAHTSAEVVWGYVIGVSSVLLGYYLIFY
jgi:hypothetical protein